MPDALKKTTGTMVAFGDVVQLSKERSQDPEADGFERYVGLEHLEPSNLKVRSWGDISDGVTFTSVFRPGQVLFGKRRAYQRKVAVADFNGVCSGDIYVLEPKGNQLLPELLSFICQSEPFYDYVLSMSQGGLSPRVNWKALAEYEFPLPPPEEQHRIAEALQSSKQLYETLRSLSESSLEVRKSAQNELLFPSRILAGNDVLRLEELTEINPTDPPLDSSAPFFPMDSLVEWERQILKYEERGTRGGVRARSGDVLMARITPCLENGKIAQVPENVDRCGASTEFIVFRPRQGVPSSYVYWLVTSDRIRNTAISLMSGTTGRQRVSGKDLEGILIPRLNMSAMIETSEIIDGIELNRQKHHARALEAKYLHIRLLNELTSGNFK